MQYAEIRLGAVCLGETEGFLQDHAWLSCYGYVYSLVAGVSQNQETDSSDYFAYNE